MSLDLSTYVANEKVIILTSSLGAFLISIISDNDLLYVIIGWAILMVSTMLQHWTKPVKTEHSKKSLLVFMIFYTMLCVAFKFFYVWVIHEGYEELDFIVSAITIGAYFSLTIGELKDTGNNIEKTYGNKNKIFKVLDKYESMINKLFEAACKPKN